MKKPPRRKVVKQYKFSAPYWTLRLSCGHEKLSYITPRTTTCAKCISRTTDGGDNNA